MIDPLVYRARVDKAKAQLNKARAQALKAKRDLDRIRPLYAAERGQPARTGQRHRLPYESADGRRGGGRGRPHAGRNDAGLYQCHSRLSRAISPSSNADIGTLVGPSGKSLLATVVKSDTVRVDFSMTGAGLPAQQSPQRQSRTAAIPRAVNGTPTSPSRWPTAREYPLPGTGRFRRSAGRSPRRVPSPCAPRCPIPTIFCCRASSPRCELLLDVRENAVVVPSKADGDREGRCLHLRRASRQRRRETFYRDGTRARTTTRSSSAVWSPANDIVVEGYHKLQHGMKVEPVVSRGATMADANPINSTAYEERISLSTGRSFRPFCRSSSSSSGVIGLALLPVDQYPQDRAARGPHLRPPIRAPTRRP